MVPSDCTKQLLIPSHKKGVCITRDYYHGTALLSIPSKIFSRASLNRLKPCENSSETISVASAKVDVVQTSCSPCGS